MHIRYTHVTQSYAHMSYEHTVLTIYAAINKEPHATYIILQIMNILYNIRHTYDNIYVLVSLLLFGKP